MIEGQRKYPVGAEVFPDGKVHFRVWSSGRNKVDIVFEEAGDNHACSPGTLNLEAENNGYFSGYASDVSAGCLYRFRLDNGPELYPDPASRFQPEGPHGPSQIIDPSQFIWTDADWKGTGSEDHIIYEMHIGTFTREGTWASAIGQLDALSEMGVTILEIMPVADFPGNFGWGYDGVNMFAPTRLYGSPDDFRRFVDRSHALHMGVILDVVYNHLGPDGNYLSQFSPHYFTDRYKNEWGDAINFDGEQSENVREYFLSNASYWIGEYHLDGLRLDATQQMYDSSSEHIVAAISRRIRSSAGDRSTFIVGENESQEIIFALPISQGGYGLDALWNDDFHHTAMVALTGRGDAYYSDYRGTPQELVSTLKRGFLYQGQWYTWQKKNRGTPVLNISPGKFINYIQNHDQIANSGSGKRCHLLTSPSRYRAVTALFLLAPQIPMLFQGQEFAASSPFFYFADQRDEIKSAVEKGRAVFLSQFKALATKNMQARLPQPGNVQTFMRSKLDHSECSLHVEEYKLHRDLLRIRKLDPVIRQSRRTRSLDGAVLGPEAFVIRFFSDDQRNDRLLIVNLGRDLHLDIAPEPLLASPEGKIWVLSWTSEDPKYGGSNTPPWPAEGAWKLQGETAVLLEPRPLECSRGMFEEPLSEEYPKPADSSCL